MMVNLLKVSSSDSYRMREGFFSRRSNLTTIALLESVNGSPLEH